MHTSKFVPKQFGQLQWLPGIAYLLSLAHNVCHNVPPQWGPYLI